MVWRNRRKRMIMMMTSTFLPVSQNTVKDRGLTLLDLYSFLGVRGDDRESFVTETEKQKFIE